MVKMLFGQETEYFLAVTGKEGKQLNRKEVIYLFFNQAQRLPHLCGANEFGIFLVSGYLYLDSGEHIEVATTECCNPWDVLKCKLAGESIISQVADDVMDINTDIGELVFSRVNVDYTGNGSTWGEHESYLVHRHLRRFDKQLIPHLVSRILYTGAGGWHSSFPGLSFMVSPRVPFFTHEVSKDSTNYRGIFHTKDESLAGSRYKYNRLHVICGEGLFSHTASLLKTGVTALVVRLIDAGKRPGEKVWLRSPLHGLRAFAQDSKCNARVQTVFGEALTAIDIQRYYLSQIVKHMSEMPAWAPEICRLWGETLDALETDPQKLRRILDWPAKLEIFSQYIESRGFSWDEINAWNQFFKEIKDVIDPALNENSFTGWLQTGATGYSGMRFLRILEKHQLDSIRLRTFLGLRQELFEIDIRCGQIGDRGIFSQIDRQGMLNHHVDGIDEEAVEWAKENPPEGSRARIRGEWIRRLSVRPGSYRCHWTHIEDLNMKKILNLSDPFEGKERWETNATTINHN